EGRNVVVTGGASGIGAACARRFARSGAKVVVADRDEEAARRLSAEIDGIAIAVDIGEEHSVAEAARRIAAEVGPVDVLINSAGVLQRTLPPDRLSMKEWDLVARIDLRGTYLCCAVFG